MSSDPPMKPAPAGRNAARGRMWPGTCAGPVGYSGAVTLPTPDSSPVPPRGGAATIFAIIAALLLPAWLTLRTVVRPAVLVPTSPDPTPYGYTWSLSLWIVPMTAILVWLRAHPDCKLPWRSFWTTVAVLVPLGVLLDIVFGNSFFTFPNAGATLQIFVWGYDIAAGTWLKNIPIEEFGFYFFGIAVALLLYLWSDIVWFGRYHPAGRFGGPVRPPTISLHWPSLLIGVSLIVAATLYKKFLSPDPCGFPGYFTFLVAAAFIPSSLLFDSVNKKINWHAFSFSALVMFFISMLWEATIAFPYEWWGYKPHMMIGEFIAAWNGLPIEEPFLWLLVSFAVVIVFEAIHLLQLTRIRRGEST